LWWHYDITVERQPVPIATFQVPGLDLDGSPQPPMSGSISHRSVCAALPGLRKACVLSTS
jgi:hypothetical protein